MSKSKYCLSPEVKTEGARGLEEQMRMGPLVWISLKRLVVQGPISYLVTGVSQFVQIGSYGHGLQILDIAKIKYMNTQWANT